MTLDICPPATIDIFLILTIIRAVS